MVNKLKKTNLGFTLVEVLAVLGIILLLIAGVFSFFLSNQKTYASGSKQVDLHNALRLTAERINREVRYAWDILLLDATQWDKDLADTDQYNYIYFDSDTRTIMVLDNTGAHPLSDQIISGITFSAKGSTLLYTVYGDNSATSFSLDSSVRPLNYDGKIYVPVIPVALRYAPSKIATPQIPSPEPEPEPEPDPDPNPDPGEDDPLTPTIVYWNLDIGAIPKVVGKKASKSFTKTWVRSSPGKIAEMEFSITRTIVSNTVNDKINVDWQLLLCYGGATQVQKEKTQQPKGRQVFNITLSDLNIPASADVPFEFKIDYSNHASYNGEMQPIFEDIQVKVTYYPVLD